MILKSDNRAATNRQVGPCDTAGRRSTQADRSAHLSHLNAKRTYIFRAGPRY